MKQCPYCGKEYPDNATICHLDQNVLMVPKPVEYSIQSIVVKRLTTRSALKIAAIGCLITFFGFSLLMGILALLGAHTVRWSGQPVVGVHGFACALYVGAMLALASTFFGWISFTVSFWLFSRFSDLTLEYVAHEPDRRDHLASTE